MSLCGSRTSCVEYLSVGGRAGGDRSSTGHGDIAGSRSMHERTRAEQQRSTMIPSNQPAESKHHETHNETAVVPSRVYGLGGAGVKLTEQVYTREQLLREILRPRKGEPLRVQVVLIDTAQNERERVATAQERIEDRRDEVKAELRESESETLGTLEVETAILTDRVLLQAGHDLTGPEVVEAVSDRLAFPPAHWPLRDADVEEDLDFGRGVFRRRAYAMALYKKARVRDREIEDLVDVPPNERAAIITGVSGGTGAGLAIDMAQQMTDRGMSDVTLFGVLPTPKEEDRVGANAYAALSELERVQLDGDQQLFRDIVLTPIDPTNYEGKRGDDVGTKGLSEFDEAFHYVFTSYYGSGQERVFGNSPDFAPFTIGLAQSQRYNVGEIERIRDNLKTACDDLGEFLQHAIRMHRRARTVVHEQYDTEAGGLTDERRSELEDWVSTFESLAERRLFEEFEYTSTSKFTTLLADARDDASTIEEQLDRLRMLTQNLTHDSLEFTDRFDESLAGTLSKSAEFLALRCQTLQDIAAIDDEIARAALVNALEIGREEVEESLLKLHRINSKTEELEEKLEDVQKDLRSATEDLETARADRRSTVERKLDTWRAETQAHREHLAVAAENSIEAPFEGLGSALESFARAVSGADSPSDVDEVSSESVLEAVSRIEDLRDRLGFEREDVDIVRREAIERSLETLKNARRKSFDTTPDLGPIAQRLPWETEKERAARQAREQFDDYRNTLEMDGIFGVYGRTKASFNCEVDYDPTRNVERLGNHRKDERRACLDVIDDILTVSITDEREAELETRLDQGQSVTGFVESIIDDHVAEPTDLKQTVAQLNDQQKGLAKRLERLEAVEELVETLVTGDDCPRTEVDTRYRTVKRAASGPEQTEPVQSDDDYTYVRTIKPDGLYDTVGEPDIAAAGLLAAEEQQQDLGEQIGDFVANARSNLYNCLDQLAITSGRRRYEGTKIHACFQSRAVSQLPDRHSDIAQALTRPFGLEQGAENCNTWRLPLGDPWDLALTVFIDGVPLDNIRNIREYRAAYRRRKQSDESIHLHHTFGLTEGRFTRRRDLVNLNDPEEAALYTSYEEEAVVERILQDYQAWIESPTNPVADVITADEGDRDERSERDHDHRKAATSDSSLERTDRSGKERRPSRDDEQPGGEERTDEAEADD